MLYYGNFIITEIITSIDQRMKILPLVVALAMCITVTNSRAQQAQELIWHNPAASAEPVIEGQFWWKQTENTYDRLPAKAKPLVREAVWNLGRNSAGEYIRFKTSATTLTVRYAVSGSLAMPHMPSTGVSGVDLYAKDKTGRWLWASGKFSLGDTIEYRFNPLASTAETEFRLYLPLYNSVKWLEVGTPAEAMFSFIPKEKQEPVVIYGTSIAQGGCASRPGLGWTNILNRLIDRNIINLAFSGNGRLEEPVIDLINEIDASVFVLDCLPNLVDPNTYPPAELKKRIVDAVKTLQSKHPATPVLLAEHSISNPFMNMDTAMLNRYSKTNIILLETFAEMKQQGVKNIYLLTAKEMGLNKESTVDGTHPNDIGMMEYAEAYAKKIKQILKKR